MWCCSLFESRASVAELEVVQVEGLHGTNVEDVTVEVLEANEQPASLEYEAPKVLLTQLSRLTNSSAKENKQDTPAQVPKANQEQSTVECEAPKTLLHQRSRCTNSSNKDTSLAPQESAPLADSPKVHRAMSLDSKLSGIYGEATGGRLAFTIPQNEAPNGTDKLPKMEVMAICAKLQRENWLPKFLKDNKQARDISATSWTTSRRAPGVMVRKATFTLPVPQDFPRAVTRLVNLPTETKVTAVFRLLPQADDVVFTIQMCSHDVPFGESFRVHETAMFKASSTGAVDFTMWVEVMWITSLPWTHGVLKSIIEQKSKADPMVGRITKTIKNE